MIGRRSKLELENKLHVYKVILKSIWTYGTQLWDTASNSNIEILQKFQSVTLQNTCNASWYVSNEIIHRDLMPLVKQKISQFSQGHIKQLSCYRNPLATNLIHPIHSSRLKRFSPLNLASRFIT